jgi:hypothetical protein
VDACDNQVSADNESKHTLVAEGQLPKGAAYIEQEQSVKRAHNEKPPHVGPGEIRKYRFCDGGSTDGTAAVYKIKNEYTSESDSERPRKMADLGPRQFEGIGPTTRDGMPLILRSVSTGKYLRYLCLINTLDN